MMSHDSSFAKSKIRKEKKKDKRIRIRNKKGLNKRRETEKKQVYYL